MLWAVAVALLFSVVCWHFQSKIRSLAKDELLKKNQQLQLQVDQLLNERNEKDQLVRRLVQMLKSQCETEVALDSPSDQPVSECVGRSWHQIIRQWTFFKKRNKTRNLQASDEFSIGLLLSIVWPLFILPAFYLMKCRMLWMYRIADWFQYRSLYF